MTMPRPFSRAASGSSRGSAHGANLRMARWAIATMTTNAAMYSTIPEGSLPVRLKPTFAKTKTTSAKAKTSMISSVRRLLRDTGTSGPVGSTAGDGAVMLLTSACGRDEGTGRDAESRRRRAHPLGLGRLRARLGDALRRLMLPRGQRHRGLVGVLLGHPVPQRGVLLPARADRGPDVRDDRLGVAQAAGRVGGLHRLLVGRRYLGELDPGRLIGLGQADPGDPLVDAAVDDHLALAVSPYVVLVLAPPPGDVAAADDDRHQHHQRGNHDRPTAMRAPGWLCPVAAA